MKKHRILVENEGNIYFSALINGRGVISRGKQNEDFHGLRNKKIHFILEGKEIFIEEITIPKVSKSDIGKMIESILVAKFHSLEEIAFNFKVIKRELKQLKVLIYCINLSNNLLLEKETLNNIHIKSVKVIQQIYAEAFERKLKKTEFSGVVVTENYLYYFHVKNKIIYENKVEEFSALQEVEEFVKNICKKNKYSKVLYLYEENPSMELQERLSSIYEVYIFNIYFQKTVKYRLKSNNYLLEV